VGSGSDFDFYLSSTGRGNFLQLCLNPVISLDSSASKLVRVVHDWGAALESCVLHPKVT
jgi:hypothetical protein